MGRQSSQIDIKNEYGKLQVRAVLLSRYNSAIVVDLSHDALRDLAEALAVDELARPERGARRRCRNEYEYGRGLLINGEAVRARSALR